MTLRHDSVARRPLSLQSNSPEPKRRGARPSLEIRTCSREALGQKEGQIGQMCFGKTGPGPSRPEVHRRASPERPTERTRIGFTLFQGGFSQLWAAVQRREAVQWHHVAHVKATSQVDQLPQRPKAHDVVRLNIQVHEAEAMQELQGCEKGPGNFDEVCHPDKASRSQPHVKTFMSELQDHVEFAILFRTRSPSLISGVV